MRRTSRIPVAKHEKETIHSCYAILCTLRSRSAPETPKAPKVYPVHVKHKRGLLLTKMNRQQHTASCPSGYIPLQTRLSEKPRASARCESSCAPDRASGQASCMHSTGPPVRSARHASRIEKIVFAWYENAVVNRERLQTWRRATHAVLV